MSMFRNPNFKASSLQAGAGVFSQINIWILKQAPRSRSKNFTNQKTNLWNKMPLLQKSNPCLIVYSHHQTNGRNFNSLSITVLVLQIQAPTTRVFVLLPCWFCDQNNLSNPQTTKTISTYRNPVSKGMWNRGNNMPLVVYQMPTRTYKKRIIIISVWSKYHKNCNDY